MIRKRRKKNTDDSPFQAGYDKADSCYMKYPEAIPRAILHTKEIEGVKFRVIAPKVADLGKVVDGTHLTYVLTEQTPFDQKRYMADVRGFIIFLNRLDMGDIFDFIDYIKNTPNKPQIAMWERLSTRTLRFHFHMRRRKVLNESLLFFKGKK